MSKPALVVLLVIIAAAAILGGFLLGRKEAIAPTPAPTATPIPPLTPVPTPTPTTPLGGAKDNPFEGVNFNPFD